ncbi:NUDIX hydrolase [Yoonia sp. SS1-5]|uniref:NUDIX hydrolase n=1 Tax=Yoonia rhodophyticola TaxID=3137370 RepID=A0AAN0MCI9_9RHOB
MIRPTLAALAVVIRDDAALLVKRRKEPDAGKWGFAGGHVEPGETALAAAVRELGEETSVMARPIRYLTNLDIIIRNKDGDLQHHFLLAAVLCAYERGDPYPADDVSDARWIKISDIAAVDTSADVQRLINLATS